MKTAAHTFAPEEIMAFVDGELSKSEAATLSTHLDQCVDCATLAEEFRDTSRKLSGWRVPAASAKLDDFVIALSETGHRPSIERPRISSSAARWNRNFWVIGGGGILAVALLSLVVFRPVFHRRKMRMPALASSREYAPAQSLGKALKALRAPAERASVESEAREQLRMEGAMDAKINPVAATASVMNLTVTAPMIARTVSLSIIVKDLGVSRSTLDGILARHHGYPAQLNAQSPDGSSRVLVASLRIPAPELNAALAELKRLGRIENESQSGEEVTQQHMDLATRLANSRETEERLRAILQQRAGSVSDVLKVEEEIARVRGEIEAMEAEQKSLEHRVNFATVDLQLSEEYKAQLESAPDSSSTRMHNAFVAGYRNASGTLLGIVLFFEEFGPVLLIWIVLLGLPLLLIWRRYRRLHS